MSKKRMIGFKWLLSLTLIFSAVLPIGNASVAAVGSTANMSESSVYIAVNDTLLHYDKIRPVMSKQTLYIPLVQTSELLGLNVSYSSQKTTITGNGKKLTLTAKQEGMLVANGRTMVSLRLLSSSFGYPLSYISSGPVYRIFTSDAKLTDREFMDKFGKEMKKPVQPKPEPAPTGNGSRKMYITFDDGPNANTGALLKVLDRYDVKATFFVLGKQIASHPAAAKQIVAKGHSVGLHGMTHQANKFYASPTSALNEMNNDNAQLYKATGIYSKLIRTPYGSKPNFKKSYRDQTAASGYHLWDWNIDSNDWRYTKNPQTIYNNVLRDVRAKKKQGITPVVLFHDQQATTSILPKLLQALKAEGYTFDVLTNDTTPLNFWQDKR
ncbi:polysaccharide deacetylase [Paenibacillus pini]|uniref:Polysaccharide deacetylase n=1 Tax=Paenibacillus pini JCM 16418 TaxID=1236976 RepID=W7YFY4_9BACL|nr:polysaccharide deacetylase [Paenibacillus pini]GAF06448.1 polysaccharide deacetylase [Paenibacillus pini JCM 16418]